MVRESISCGRFFSSGMGLLLALEVTEHQKKGNVNDKVPAPIT